MGVGMWVDRWVGVGRGGVKRRRYKEKVEREGGKRAVTREEGQSR